MSVHDQIEEATERRIDAVLFDFDGTLTEPSAIDFAAAREAMGCPPDSYTLEYIAGLPEGDERERATAILADYEERGAASSRPGAGAEETVEALVSLGLPVGVLTRNGLAAVRRSLANFERLKLDDFDVVITRDDPVAPKPAPDAVLRFAARVGVDPEHVLMVGDFILDVQAGRAAGAQTAYLQVTDHTSLGDDELFAKPGPDVCDHYIDTLDEVLDIVRDGRPLPDGKLPNDLLARFLGEVAGDDPAVLVGAGVGEDVAALDVSCAETLVVHGDPITLSGGDVGRWAVLVNANDVAAAGALPRWFLTTVLLPSGTTGAQARRLLASLRDECARQGVAIVGGHTEITPQVTQPVVCGTMLATLARADLRDKRDVREGDALVLTKALAIEGTALLADELAGTLRTRGLSDDELAACRALLAELSVVPEARAAAGVAGVHALHDVTEGGLATALAELSTACGHTFTVARDRVPVLPETTRVCTLLECDPLGLIASGSLVICCAPGAVEELLTALTDKGIAATVIGAVAGHGVGVSATSEGRAASWPRFARDEAARLLAEGRGAGRR